MTGTPPRPRFVRSRAVGAVVLLVVGLVVALAANVTTWTQDVLLDTNEWVAAVGPLSQEPEVADAIADFMVTELAEVSEEQRAEARAALPEGAKTLTGLLRPALAELIREQTSSVIQSDQFQEIWIQANRLAHETLAAVLSGDDPDRLLQTSNGEVRLDLSEAVVAVRAALGEDAQGLLGEPTEGQGVIVIATSDQLAEAQDAVNILETLGIVLVILAFVLLIASVAIAVDRRRFLVAVGLGLAIVMAITLISLDVGRGEIVNLIEDQTVKLAGGTTFDVVTDNLNRQSWIILALGLILAGGAWLAGPSRYAVSVRAAARRFALSARGAAGLDQIEGGDRVGSSVREHRGLLQILGVAVALIVLIAWNSPSWVTVVVVVGLLAVWLVMLEVLAPRRLAAKG